MKNLIKTNKQRKYLRIFFFLLYTGAIFFISNIKSFSSATGFTYEDKIKHFIEYFGYSIVVSYFFRDIFKKKHILITIVFCLLYAISDEIHQGFVGYFDTGIFSGIRDCSFYDWIADSLGVFSGVFFYTKLKNMSNFKSNNI